jgi:hypothetical protein
MSTRSRIGILNGNDAITSVYCHSDGYPSWNGKVLLENYQTTEKITELLSYGDISSLYPSIGTKHGFDLSQRPEGVSTFYKRDRNETDVDANTSPASEYGTLCDSCDAEFAYLFKEGEWYVSPVKSGGKRLKFERVADVLAKEKVAQDA